MGLGSRLWMALPEQGVGPNDLQRCLPTSASLWFCEKEHAQGEQVTWSLGWMCWPCLPLLRAADPRRSAWGTGCPGMCRSVMVLHNQKWAANLMQTVFGVVTDVSVRGSIPVQKTAVPEASGDLVADIGASGWNPGLPHWFVLAVLWWVAWLTPCNPMPRGAGRGAFVSQVCIWRLLWKWSKRLARTVWNYSFKIFLGGEGKSFFRFFPLLKCKFTQGIVT